MKTLAVIALVAVLSSGILLWPTAVPIAAGGASSAEASAAVGPTRLRGVAFQITSSYDFEATYLRILNEVTELGANSVLICPSGHMEHAKAQAIFIDARKTPSKTELLKLLGEARQRNLHVTVMPILLLSNPRGSEWRGVIEPPDWETWWRDYREFLLFYADIAREGGANAFILGSELVSTEKYTDQWKKAIETVRGRFGGQLGYSANWDHYKPVQFWDKLDFVGMTSYYTLADKKNPSVDEIVARWQPIFKEVEEWRRQMNKPLVLTEVGWCSQEGAATAPWNYYQNQKATPEGHEEQRRLYEAFLRVWDEKPGIEGIYWWEWTPGSGGPSDFGYTPKGKPAEKLLREWFERMKAAQPGTNGG